MKKIILICITIILFFTCISCEKTVIDTSLNDSEDISDVRENVDKYLNINLPQLEKENQRLYYIEWGRLTENTYDDAVMIFSDSQYIEWHENKIYMVADIGGILIVYDLGTADIGYLQNGKLILDDIDEDGIDEIIFNAEISSNGGTISKIFKIVNDEIIQMKDLDDLGELSKDNLGYGCKFLENYILKITNKYTGDVAALDLSTEYPSELFDETGFYKGNESVRFRTFDSHVDIAHINGEPLILYKQYVQFFNIIGETVTSLKYNTETQSFDVVNAQLETINYKE